MSLSTIKRFQARNRRDNSSLGALDYMLMAAGNCFAVYSAGMAVGVPEVAQFFVFAIIAGATISLLVRRGFGNTKFVKIDVLFYSTAACAAVIFTPQLNQILPGDGIPADVLTAGWLCWMLAFGSALTWRDRTLLFQAVPTIALFGLVGCYDTFAAAPLMFFGFLLTLATLLARSNSREMLRQAVESGYFNRADAPNAQSEYPEQSPELYEDIKKGPWRWLAGPEWALASGLAIVCVSALGAPVIRQVVAPISGVIKVMAPKGHSILPPSTPAVPITEDHYEVGRGALFNTAGKVVPLYVVRMDHVRYLRTGTFDEYTGHGWKNSYSGSSPEDDNSPDQYAIKQMKDRQAFQVSILPETYATTVPLPAETLDISAEMPVRIRADGGGDADSMHLNAITVDAIESKLPPLSAPKDLPPNLAECLDAAGVVPSVRAFADEAVRSAKATTDIDKANAVRNAVSRRVGYSLQASAVPEDADAADFVLNQSKVGYCDLFATAMVMCARAEHLPARYALGYLADPTNQDASGQYTIVDRDYHAWAEVFFNGVGWVVFDATGGATTVDNRQNKGSFGSNMLAMSLNVLIGVVAVGLMVAGLLSWRRKQATATTRSEIEKTYTRFASVLRKASGRRRQPAETPDEYLEAVSPYLNGLGSKALDINRRFNEGLFSQMEITPNILSGLKADVGEFAKAVKRNKKPS